MEKKKLFDAMVRLTMVIAEQKHISPQESEAIFHVLNMCAGGEAQALIAKYELQKIQNKSFMQKYFLDNPKRQVAIVGNSHIPKDQVVKITRQYGVFDKQLLYFKDYRRLEHDFPFERLQNENTVAILMSAMPHNVPGINGFNSPVEAIGTMGKISFSFPEFKVTKAGLKTCMDKIALTLHQSHLTN